MNALVYHIISGQALFARIALIVLAAVATTSGRPVVRRPMAASFLLDAFAILVSSTAIPCAYYAFAFVISGDGSGVKEAFVLQLAPESLGR